MRPEWQDVYCLAEHVWVFSPIAGLVEGGGFAGTDGRAVDGVVAVVDVVGGVHLAACGVPFAGSAIFGFRSMTTGTRLSPDLALDRGHPIARWRGQHVGGGASGAEVEICACFVSAVGLEPGSFHGEFARNVSTSTLTE